ncbi:MAG: hypothetical protein Ct9H300mP2_1350 [Candidatus Neomarinimicrobiota bacterium]|nr:MAG: hypothetical protein Ct9H300mP2_1350 [Candidatus Neomarinimicrobiota bacterium]
MNSVQKTIFLVAGEPSGDIHGARLVSAMKKGQSNIYLLDMVVMKWHRRGNNYRTC